jgi:tuftelin-interacting protein 11
LVSSPCDLATVADPLHRFVWWKGRFPEAVLAMKGIAHIFNAGLELMHDAMRLGTDAPTKLRKPVFVPLLPSKSSSKTTQLATPRRVEAPVTTDITFRSLAEDYATQNDLIFLPVGRSHDKTGKPLFKVCKSVTGRGGVTVYVGENAVFAQVEDGTFKAVSLDDMVKRALA